MKAKSEYYLQLDGLRTIAVSMVMFGHWVIYPKLLSIGAFLSTGGVDIFFVLSGFLISGILIKASDNTNKIHALKQFYIRRFLRIFPLYYLVILIGVLIAIPNIRQQFWWFLFYAGNIIVAKTNGTSGSFTHLWSLAVEEQFYIFFPFIVFFVPKKNRLISFSLMIVMSVLCRAIIYLVYKQNINIAWWMHSLTFCCLDSFGLGALLAYLKIYHFDLVKRILKKWGLFFWALGASILLGYVFTLGSQENLFVFTFHRLFFSIFCFWVVGVATTDGFKGVIKLFFENNFIQYLGKISYGLYVYHHFMPYFFGRVGYNINGHSILLNSFLYLIATIIISSISWHFFEYPINKLKERFSYN